MYLRSRYALRAMGVRPFGSGGLLQLGSLLLHAVSGLPVTLCRLPLFLRISGREMRIKGGLKRLTIALSRDSPALPSRDSPPRPFCALIIGKVVFPLNVEIDTEACVGIGTPVSFRDFSERNNSGGDGGTLCICYLYSF
ncbi:hypothetical protein OpiT1DRAFT_00184 [Opitutaceae bacterium TAV1]|nr:hypothetical protein OpiT1DRAFT_00184 [Opitutaceae bacterium TAV1]